MENKTLEYNKESVETLIAALNNSVTELKAKGKPHGTMHGRIKALESLRDNRVDNFMNELLLECGAEILPKDNSSLTVNRAFYFRKKLCETMKTAEGEKKSFLKGASYVFELLLLNKLEEVAEKRGKKLQTSEIMR